MNETFSFDWALFQPGELEEFRETAKKDVDWQRVKEYADRTYLGCVRVGDLCFDVLTEIVVADDGNYDLHLGFDLYVGGVDDGYGYSNRPDAEGYPYTYYDGGMFTDTQTCCFADYPEFVKYAESVFTNYILENDKRTSLDLIDKARQPLHCW